MTDLKIIEEAFPLQGDFAQDAKYTWPSRWEAVKDDLAHVPEVAPTFEQVRDAIVARMGGHTFSLRDAPAVENFMALLAMVKREECSLPSPLAPQFKEKP